MMRDTLLQAIEQVRTGSMAPEKAKAIAALAHQVNSSLEVELKVLVAAQMGKSAANLLEPAGPVQRQISSGTVESSAGVTRHSMGATEGPAMKMRQRRRNHLQQIYRLKICIRCFLVRHHKERACPLCGSSR